MRRWNAGRFLDPAGRLGIRTRPSRPDLLLRAAFKLALRQIEGLMTSVLSLMGLTISAPDHTTVSRRAVTLPVIQATSIPHGPLHLLIDSTGL
jgi:Transposase DDE domain